MRKLYWPHHLPAVQKGQGVKKGLSYKQTQYAIGLVGLRALRTYRVASHTSTLLSTHFSLRGTILGILKFHHIVYLCNSGVLRQCIWLFRTTYWLISRNKKFFVLPNECGITRFFFLLNLRMHSTLTLTKS